jgi:ParB family chromosome partitioning protein
MTTTSGTIVDVDPKTLTIAMNVRPDAKLNEDLIASIKDIGILQPPMVTANEAGGYDVVIGQRRTLAAVQAGLKSIPVYLVTAREAAAAQLVDQIAENEQRLALTNAERAGGYQQLSLFGMSVDEIAKKNRVPKKLVENALTVAGNEKVTAIVTKHEIDLEQAAAIVEFADDKRTLAQLTETASSNPTRLAYEIREAQRKRKLAASKKDLAEKLKSDRTTIVKASEYPAYGASGTGSRLSRLRSAAGKELSMTAHKKCPGHAGFVESDSYADHARIVYVCTDYVAHGHTTIKNAYVRELTEEEIAAQEARDKEIADRDIVRQLRTDFIVALLQRKTFPLATEVDQILIIGLVGVPAWTKSRYSATEDALLPFTYLQIPFEGKYWEAPQRLAEYVDQVIPSHARVVQLAAALGALEWYVRSQRPDSYAVEYFETLARWGHTLSDREQRLIRQVKEVPAPELSDDEKAIAEHFDNSTSALAE